LLLLLLFVVVFSLNLSKATMTTGMSSVGWYSAPKHTFRWERIRERIRERRRKRRH